MFYGSHDIPTVLAEIGAHRAKPYAVVGTFRTVRELTMLNLVDLPPVPREFTDADRAQHFDVRFVHQFAADLAKPIVVDGREHIDYAPTKVVTESLRWIPHFELDGILCSSAHNGGVCCVLFCDATGCADPDTRTDNAYLTLAPDSPADRAPPRGAVTKPASYDG